jgi:hypothetical protein
MYLKKQAEADGNKAWINNELVVHQLDVAIGTLTRRVLKLSHGQDNIEPAYKQDLEFYYNLRQEIEAAHTNIQKTTKVVAVDDAQLSQDLQEITQHQEFAVTLPVAAPAANNMAGINKVTAQNVYSNATDYLPIKQQLLLTDIGDNLYNCQAIIDTDPLKASNILEQLIFALPLESKYYLDALGELPDKSYISPETASNLNRRMLDLANLYHTCFK